ncbi:hypothetical protein FIBSPDRAFT_959237 [Athelia psychrophila]|uniref:Uncharacterized protein n=1 Tax=Athelia psychrophila TaxID=1759441 RepID=A0A166DPV8_9AGAM|nr:hypothetical protein FIBSPDRAFT_959237 [Fibularhizoctonia sp. CBS 109695]
MQHTDHYDSVPVKYNFTQASRFSNDNHEQSNHLAQPVPPTSPNLENGTQPRSPRPPARQVFAGHDVNEEWIFDSYGNGPGDEGLDGFLFTSGVEIQRPDRSRAKYVLEEAECPTSAPITTTTTTTATPSPPSLLKRLVRRFQSIKIQSRSQS